MTRYTIMNCPSCSCELEIFRSQNQEIWVCPSCLSALLPDESTAAALNDFCSAEILMPFINAALDGSLLKTSSQGGPAAESRACPKCRSFMHKTDLNGKLKFRIDRCVNCNALWVDAAQAPLVTAALLPAGPEYDRFRKTMTEIGALAASRRSMRAPSFDALIAPYVVLSGLIPSIPMGDDVASPQPTLTTRGLMIGCVVIFVLQMLLPPLTRAGLLTADAVLQQGEWYRLFSYALLHGGIIHLAGNMLFLRVFGKTVEQKLRPLLFLGLFFLGAVVSGILFMATVRDKSAGCVGASGAIAAVIAAYLVFFPRARIRFRIVHPFTFQKIRETEIPGLYYILFWFVFNLIMGAMHAGGRTTGIAYWGHIGGFVAGILGAEAYKYFKQV